MKVEIISANPAMCREWVEKPDRDRYYTGSRDLLGELHDQFMWEVYDRDLSLYNQRIASLPTYLLISDRQYRVGEVVEVELKPSGKSGEWSKLVAIPVQPEAGEVEAVRFAEWIQDNEWSRVPDGWVDKIQAADVDISDWEFITTEQLYSLFKKPNP